MEEPLTEVECVSATTVRTSYYYAVRSQTDATPLRTADQSKINRKKLRRGELKWLAVSRDLHRRYGGALEFGDTVKVRSLSTGKTEKWVVRDLMHRRFRSRVDFLLPIGKKYREPKIELIWNH
jgi:hypothetical protein